MYIYVFKLGYRFLKQIEDRGEWATAPSQWEEESLPRCGKKDPRVEGKCPCILVQESPD
jgi:hypothetical protein